MTAVGIQSISNAVKRRDINAYFGIAYCMGEVHSGLSQVFAEPFAVAKAAGFKVLVPVCHSAPYGITNAISTVLHNWLCFGGFTRELKEESYVHRRSKMGVIFKWD
jgi:hypothetical protein